MNELLLLPGGIVAGIVNAVAGGGSLITFPLMLAVGYSPLQANVTNAVGIFASNFGAVWGYRHELRRSPRRATIFCIGGTVGSLIGSVLLLMTGEAFASIVSWLILLAVVLVLLQPIVVRRAKQDHKERSEHFPWAVLAGGIIAIYGGYFGVAMGVMFLGVVGMLLQESLQRLNAYKNVVAIFINATSLILFTLFGPVDWSAAGFMAVGTIIGGFIGAHVALRLPDKWFRAAVSLVGLVAALTVAVK